jgi:hypothetical protein
MLNGPVWRNADRPTGEQHRLALKQASGELYRTTSPSSCMGANVVRADPTVRCHMPMGSVMTVEQLYTREPAVSDQDDIPWCIVGCSRARRDHAPTLRSR